MPVPTRNGNAQARLEDVAAEDLRAAYERSLNVLQELVEAHPELVKSYATDRQAVALWAAQALLVEAGRRLR